LFIAVAPIARHRQRASNALPARCASPGCRTTATHPRYMTQSQLPAGSTWQKGHGLQPWRTRNPQPPPGRRRAVWQGRCL